MPNTDDADWRTVLLEVRRCAAAWTPEARLLGNVRAGDIVKAVDEALRQPVPLPEELQVAARREIESLRQKAGEGFWSPNSKMALTGDCDDCGANYCHCAADR